MAGIAGESGEINEAWKKYLRGDYNLTELKRRLVGEFGDALWYIRQAALELGIMLDDVAEFNIEKLQTRRVSNSIKGDGDRA